MHSVNEFFAVVFDALEDKTCFAKQPYDTQLNSVMFAEMQPCHYFSVNAMQGSRADANVTKHRSFLLEFDNMAVPEQLMLPNKRGLTVAGQVFSGNKSVHSIITLQEPVSAEKYAELAKRLMLLFPEADPTCKNPSRLSRMPGVINAHTGKLQELLYVGHRTSLGDLELVLPPLPAEKPVKRTSDPIFISQLLVSVRISPDEAIEVLGLGGRNALFYWIGQRLKDSNKPMEWRREFVHDCYAALKNKTDFTLQEAKAAARV